MVQLKYLKETLEDPQTNVQEVLSQVYEKIIFNNRIDLMKMIIDCYNFDITRENNKPIYLCCIYHMDYGPPKFEMLKLLLSYVGDNILLSTLEKHKEAFHNSMEDGSLDMIKLILDLNFDIYSHDGVAFTVYRLFPKDLEKYIQLLLDYGVDINYNNCNLLSIAIGNNNIKAIELAMAYAPSNDVRLNRPLMSAVQSGRIAVVKMLLEYGADVNCDNNSALKKAVYNIKSIDMVNLLLDYGADINCENDIVFKLAIQLAKPDLVQLLLDRGANIDSFVDCDILEFQKYHPVFKILVSRGVSPCLIGRLLIGS